MVDTSGTASEPRYCTRCGTAHNDYRRLNHCPHDGGLLTRQYQSGRPIEELQCDTCYRYFLPVGNDYLERK